MRKNELNEVNEIRKMMGLINEVEENKVIETIKIMVNNLNPEMKNKLKLFSDFNDNQKVMFFDYMMANLNESK
jgi:hypothetical protein